MRTLLLAPELYRSEGGIPRILRLYRRALVEEARSDEAATGNRRLDVAEGNSGVDVIVLNDHPSSPALVAGSRDPAGELVGCDRSKLAFILQVLRRGWSAERVICGHVHLLPVCWLLKCLRSRTRYFLVAHGIEVWRPFSRGERRALRSANGILCVSGYTRGELLKHAPELDPARVVVVPNAIDPGFAPIEPDGRGKAESAGSAPDDTASQVAGPAPPVRASPRILTVARLTSVDREKGVETVIQAMPAIRRAHPEAQLRIVGGGDDEARLRELAESLGLGIETGVPNREEPKPSGARAPGPGAPRPRVAAVVFAGKVDDRTLRAEYAACDLFALPSRKEGFGMVYLEAMAFGKPCIAVEAGGAPEVIGGGPDSRRPKDSRGNRTTPFGTLVPYGEPAAIAAAVDELVADPRASAEIRAQAEKFDYESFKSRLRDALSQD